jgi:hypothetical protein
MVRNALVVSGEYITHLTRTALKEIEGKGDSRIPCLTLGDSGAALILESAPNQDVGFKDIEMYTLGTYSDLCIAKPTTQEHGGAIMITESVKLHAEAIKSSVLHVVGVLTSRKALKAGFQVCSHAIGDRANREILDRYETAFKENPDVKDHRFRIEHAQHLHPNDIPRFGQLGVLPAMQAIHMSSDRPWAIERLGEKRINEGAYMWQSLLKSGAKIINGTDAPVEPVNPIPSFYASVTRKTLKGEPEGGYEPEEKMTREQALRSYTLDAAYGAFEENIKGSIEVGKLADFTILSSDIMKVSEIDILKTEVIMTIVGGKIVFEK